mmetsp:Transcript_28530/g.101031  ORF Transcript_28530/g.101031 Transcript_28530/m.101031 type:complete len:244 (+) Transcript_28530:1226-1957(+)
MAPARRSLRRKSRLVLRRHTLIAAQGLPGVLPDHGRDDAVLPGHGLAGVDAQLLRLDRVRRVGLWVMVFYRLPYALRLSGQALHRDGDPVRRRRRVQAALRVARAREGPPHASEARARSGGAPLFGHDLYHLHRRLRHRDPRAAVRRRFQCLGQLALRRRQLPLSGLHGLLPLAALQALPHLRHLHDLRLPRRHPGTLRRGALQGEAAHRTRGRRRARAGDSRVQARNRARLHRREARPRRGD